MTRKVPCQYEPGSTRKRMLYVGSGVQSFESLIGDIASAPSIERVPSDIYPVFKLREQETELIPVWDTRGATDALRSA
ncbi:MAG: hypothetical protein JSV06_05325, partial [Myxococcales bacterium]